MCGEEWSKLHPVSFLWDGRVCHDAMCVECAEGVKSLERIADLFPIPGVTIEMSWMSNASHSIPSYVDTKIVGYEKMFERHKRYALIKSGTLSFVLTSQAIPPYLLFKQAGQDESGFADNILAAWSKIERLITQHGDPSADLSPSKYQEIERKIRSQRPSNSSGFDVVF